MRRRTNKTPGYYESIRKKRIYREGFIERVKMAREASGKTTQQVAEALGIPHRRYLSYEKRTELRFWLSVPFCEATGADLAWLFREHRPRERLPDDVHWADHMRELYGPDSTQYRRASYALAETKRAIELGAHQIEDIYRHH